MSRNGLLINYQWCTGCHSCEIACRNEKNIPLGQWGIKMMEIGPWELKKGKFEWDYLPVPSSLCDLCSDRIAQDKKPACVHHCLAQCIEYGTLEELMQKAENLGDKVSIFIP